METVDQTAWLEGIQKARGMTFYVYRFAEIWANAVEFYIKDRTRKGQPPLSPSRTAEIVADAHFWAEEKVLSEMREKHSLPNLPPPDATQVLEVLQKHWKLAELLKGWRRDEAVVEKP